MPEGEQGLNVARLISLLADLGPDVGGQTINRFCSSGLQSIATAAGSIAVGSTDVVLAGGVESMTYVPMTGFHLSASPELQGQAARREHTDGHHGGERRKPLQHLSYSAGRVRVQQRSMKAKKALEKGVLQGRDHPRARDQLQRTASASTRTSSVDELPRPDTTLEGLAKLPPAFAQGGSVTAGNSLADLRRCGGGPRRIAREGQCARRQAARDLSELRHRRCRPGDHGHWSRCRRYRSCSPRTT